jgi:hypothetical protein
MTGRRKGERRSGQWTHFVVATDDKRSGEDRRMFLRRMADLAAELEALDERDSRTSLLITLQRELDERGVL